MTKFILFSLFFFSVSSLYGQSFKFPKVDDKATFENVSKKYENLPTNQGGLKQSNPQIDTLQDKKAVLIPPKKIKTKTKTNKKTNGKIN